jgi:hypothetical protein
MALGKKVLLCVVVMALMAIGASSASADRLPEGPGQPAISGHFGSNGEQGVAHCEALLELFSGQEIAPGTYPGGIVLLPSGELQFVGPTPCPIF